MWFYFWFWENTARGYLTCLFHLFLSFLTVQPGYWIFLLNSLSPPALKGDIRGSGSSELAIFLPRGTYLQLQVSSDGTTKLQKAETWESRIFFPFCQPPTLLPLPTYLQLARIYLGYKSTDVPFLFWFKATVISCLGLLQQPPSCPAGFFLCSSLIHFVYWCQWSLRSTDHMLLCYPLP